MASFERKQINVLHHTYPHCVFKHRKLHATTFLYLGRGTLSAVGFPEPGVREVEVDVLTALRGVTGVEEVSRGGV